MEMNLCMVEEKQATGQWWVNLAGCKQRGHCRGN